MKPNSEFTMKLLLKSFHKGQQVTVESSTWVSLDVCFFSIEIQHQETFAFPYGSHVLPFCPVKSQSECTPTATSTVIAHFLLLV